MEKISKSVKAVIFDMDGTIIKTEHIWNGVVLALLHEKGITEFSEADSKVLDSLSGTSLKHASHTVKQHFGLIESPEDLAMLKLELANREFAKTVEFIEGFEIFHEKIRDHKIPSAIATNAHPKNLETLITSMNFKKYFGSNIYCIADVEYKAKPDPAVFLHAAKQLGVSPEECIVFEDSLPGFKAAQAAGMKCIAIKNHLNSELVENATRSIHSYHDAEETLKELIELNLFKK